MLLHCFESLIDVVHAGLLNELLRDDNRTLQGILYLLCITVYSYYFFSFNYYCVFTHGIVNVMSDISISCSTHSISLLRVHLQSRSGPLDRGNSHRLQMTKFTSYRQTILVFLLHSSGRSVSNQPFSSTYTQEKIGI